MMKNVLIIGASSAIAEATARQFAKKGERIFLIARDMEKLSVIAKDLKIRGARKVECAILDVTDFERHSTILDFAFNNLGAPDIVLIAHGSLPKQQDCMISASTTISEFNTNAVSTIALLTDISNRLEKQGHGIIVVITSVAGDRGRQSNYVYGAAKGAVSIFIQGLQHRFYRTPISIINIKPGLVDTPMTSSIEKTVLWVTPEIIAGYILRSLKKRKHVVYAPTFWRFIMLIIRLTPARFFHKTNL